MHYHPLMSSITNCSSQCSIIPLCPVLQTTAASAVSSPYVQYYKQQQPMQYHPLISSITNYNSQCSIIPLCPVLQTVAASAVSSPYVQYYKLQQPVQYHPLMSSITNYSRQCSIIPLCPVLQTTSEVSGKWPSSAFVALLQFNHMLKNAWYINSPLYLYLLYGNSRAQLKITRQLDCCRLLVPPCWRNLYIVHNILNYCKAEAEMR